MQRNLKAPLTIIAIAIGLSINAQEKKLNDLSDALVEGTSLYVGNDPSSTTDSATSNIALGKTALKSITTGDKNTAIGDDALSLNNTGSSNTASGYQTLYNNSSGNDNTASGCMALSQNTSGEMNTATGYQALLNNTLGDKNTAYGTQALFSNTLGHYNTASGMYSLHYNTTGNYNTASGYEALYNNTSGNYNTALGYGTKLSNSLGTNQTVIGYEAQGQADNSVVLGNSEVTKIYMAQDAGATVYARGGNFTGDMTISGNILVSSDARLKANIVSLGATLAKLLLLDGKTYTMKKDGKQKIGVLAQDIEKIFPELVSEDDNKILAVNYQGLIPILINALKEQNSKLTERSSKLKKVDVKISKLKLLVEKLIAHK